MVRDQLLKLAEENLDIDTTDLDFEEKITNMDIDSIDLVDFIMVVEEEFDIEFTDEELDEIETLSDIVSLIESKN